MALNFDNKPLFQGIPAEEHLKQRWQQEGSVKLNVTFDETDDGTVIKTKTKNKIYVVQILITNAQACSTARYIRFLDNGVEIIRFNNGNSVSGQQFDYRFEVPLEFNTNIYLDTDTGTSYDFDGVCMGWEE